MAKLLMLTIFLILMSIGSSHAQYQGLSEARISSLCNEGDLEACVWLGVLALGSESNPKRKEGQELLERACMGGAGSGCTFFGFSRYENTGKAERDFAKAREYYKMGCDSGHAYGCTLLGIHYEMAWDVDQDLSFAKHKYEQGCSMGDYPACTHLGRWYKQGIGVDQNAEQSRFYYSRACELGNKRVCLN
ncbi:MAG: tetratricopeptide repeat protein [Pseudomonadota bacterium]